MITQASGCVADESITEGTLPDEPGSNVISRPPGDLSCSQFLQFFSSDWVIHGDLKFSRVCGLGSIALSSLILWRTAPFSGTPISASSLGCFDLLQTRYEAGSQTHRSSSSDPGPEVGKAQRGHLLSCQSTSLDCRPGTRYAGLFAKALGHVGRVIATTFETLECLRERYKVSQATRSVCVCVCVRVVHENFHEYQAVSSVCS